MKRLVLFFAMTTLLLSAMPAAAEWRVTSDRKVPGFGNPESVAYDAVAGELYVSRFGSGLKPSQKDGQGHISRVSLDGRVLKERLLPPPGYTLHKPKGVWTDGKLLWTTDIDKVWVFDLATGKARSLALPGAVFANDVVVAGGKLYVSDTGTGTIYGITPADLLSPAPQVDVVMRMNGLAPNGLWVTRKGQLLFGTWPSSGPPGGIYMMTGPGKAKEVSPELGTIDGLSRLADGSILYTNWAKGGLFMIDNQGQIQRLAGDFKGPADFAVIERGKEVLVVVPDLVKGELRFITLTR